MKLPKLASLESALGDRSIESLRDELVALREERRAYAREHARLVDDAHAGVDVSMAAAREAFEREAQNARTSWGTDPRPRAQMAELGALYAATLPGFAEALHAAVDGPAPIGAPDLSRVTRKERDAELARLDGEIRSRDGELERREIAAREQEVARDLADLEARI